MSLYDGSPAELIEVVGAAAAGGILVVDFTPDAGDVWEIEMATVVHDDAAAPDAHWRLDNGVIDTPLGGLTPYAAGENAFLSDDTPGITYHLTDALTLRYIAPAGATAGAIATMWILGRRLRGTI